MNTNHPLLFTFKRGIVPQGLFCGLVTYLIDKCDWKFRQQSDQNYRTQVEFKVSSNKLVLVEKFKFIQVHIAPHATSSACLQIRKDVVDGVETICEKFYRSKDNSIINPYYASFECSCSSSDEPHVASIAPATDTVKEPLLVCKNTDEPIEFIDYMYKWLQENEDPRLQGTYMYILCVDYIMR